MRGLLVRGLAAMGVTAVIEADSAEAAIRRLALNEVGLILTDVEMPGMGGLEFIWRIRTGETPARPDIRVIVITGLSDMNVLKEAVALDIQGFLTKPITPKVLEEKVNEVLRRPVKLRLLQEYLDAWKQRKAAPAAQSEGTRQVSTSQSVTPTAPVVEPDALGAQVPTPASVDRVACIRPVAALVQGMTLAADLTVRGNTLMQAGTCLTDAHITVLTSMATMLDQNELAAYDPKT